MAIQLRAANAVISVSNAASTTVTLPAGAAAGDICFIVFRIGTNGLTVTQTGGSPTWTIQFQGNDGTTHFTYAFATAVLQPGFTAPTFSWTTSTTWMYAVIALKSSVGAALSVDAWNSAVVNTSAAANTVTPNAVTAAGAGEASVILTAARGSPVASGTDTGTFTPSTGWTTPASGTVFGSANGTNNRFAGVDYQLGVGPGSVAPGTESLTDSESHQYTFTVAHVLAKEAGAATGTPAQVTVPIPRPRQRRALIVPPWLLQAARPVLVTGRVVIPPLRPKSRSPITMPRQLPGPAIAPVTGRTVAPAPRPRLRGMVIGPRSLLASPVPPVPGKPVLIAPLPLRLRRPVRAVVITRPLIPIIIPARVVIADDGDAPWHIRIRRRRT